jgi:hypothetical protein
MRRYVVRLMILVFAFVGVRNALAQQTFPTFGAGNFTCGDLLKYRAGKTANDKTGLFAIQSWVHGYVTAHAASSATLNLVDDYLFEHTTPEITAARRAYCKSTSTDRLCSSGSFTTPYQWRTGSALKQTNVNGINAWLDQYCTTRPLEPIKKVAETLSLELDMTPKDTVKVPPQASEAGR